MTMFCDCGNPEAHRGEHIPKPVTDTPLDLDAIEARANAATSGPWSAADEHGLLGPTSTPAWCVSRMTDPTPARPDGWMYDIAYVEGDDREYNPDAEFIAHARTDVPALVAALRKAEAQVAHWEQAAIDASSEVEGYRTGLAAQVVTRERDASRTAHAALVAGIETGLRESACAECDHDRCATYRSAASWVRDYAALDRHAPTTGATP